MLMLITNVLLVNEDEQLFAVRPTSCVFFLFFLNKIKPGNIDHVMLLADLRRKLEVTMIRMRNNTTSRNE